MPAALKGVALKIAYGLFTAGASAGTAQLVAATFYYATSAFLLNRAVAALTKRGRTGETRGLEVSLVDSTAPARIVYGEVRTGGVNMLPPYVTGNNGEHLHQVLAFALHEITSFEEFYFDQVALPTPTAVVGNANDGLITSGAYANGAWVRGYLGTMTQNVDFKLTNAMPAQWPSTARGRGVAYAAMQYAWGDGRQFKQVPVVTARIRGAKVYDPRLDSTNGGSGAHRIADPSTWAYSNNPALCWANYMVMPYGYAVENPLTDINWPSVIAAANVCDQLVANRVGGTERRYTCNGIIVNTPESLLPNARAIVDAMFGRMVNTDGRWSCYAGAWTAPEFTIDREDWLAIDDIQAVAPRDGGRFNQVRCFYVDPARNWQRVECFPRRNASYQSADAAELISIEMEQPLCTGEDEAQRKAEFLLRTSRNGVRLVGTLPPRFLKLRTFSTVALNFAELGWVSKTFRVAALDLNEDGSVRVALVEEQSADWADLTAGEYNAPSTATIPAVNPTTPSEAPLTLSSMVNGTIQFSIANPVVRPADTKFQIIRSTNSGNAAVGSVIYDGISQEVLLPAPSSLHWYWSRAVVNSYFGPYHPNTFGIAGNPTAVVPLGFATTQIESRGTGNDYLHAITSYTAPADTAVFASMVYRGSAQFDGDSGTFASIVLLSPSSIDTGLGVDQIPSVFPSSGYVPGAFATFPAGIDNITTVSASGKVNVNSGTSYVFGIVTKIPTGSMRLRSAALSLQASQR